MSTIIDENDMSHTFTIGKTSDGMKAARPIYDKDGVAIYKESDNAILIVIAPGSIESSIIRIEKREAFEEYYHIVSGRLRFECTSIVADLRKFSCEIICMQEDERVAGFWLVKDERMAIEPILSEIEKLETYNEANEVAKIFI